MPRKEPTISHAIINGVKIYLYPSGWKKNNTQWMTTTCLYCFKFGETNFNNFTLAKEISLKILSRVYPLKGISNHSCTIFSLDCLDGVVLVQWRNQTEKTSEQPRKITSSVV
ncbi:hypothetical protein ACJX0J_037139 [Zea mays]